MASFHFENTVCRYNTHMIEHVPSYNGRSAGVIESDLNMYSIRYPWYPALGATRTFCGF